MLIGCGSSKTRLASRGFLLFSLRKSPSVSLPRVPRTRQSLSLRLFSQRRVHTTGRGRELLLLRGDATDMPPPPPPTVLFGGGWPGAAASVERSGSTGGGGVAGGRYPRRGTNVADHPIVFSTPHPPPWWQRVADRCCCPCRGHRE